MPIGFKPRKRIDHFLMLSSPWPWESPCTCRDVDTLSDPPRRTAAVRISEYQLLCVFINNVGNIITLALFAKKWQIFILGINHIMLFHKEIIIWVLIINSPSEIGDFVNLNPVKSRCMHPDNYRFVVDIGHIFFSKFSWSQLPISIINRIPEFFNPVTIRGQV